MNFLIWRTFNFRFLRYRCLLLKNNILHHRAPRTAATWTLLEGGYELSMSSAEQFSSSSCTSNSSSLDFTSSALQGGYELSMSSSGEQQITSSSCTSNSSSYSMDDAMMLSTARNVVYMNYFYNYILCCILI